MFAVGFANALSSSFAVDAGSDVVAVDVPPLWAGWKISGGYVGPLLAQMDLARGAAHEYRGGGALIGGRVLVGGAGNAYAFVSAGALEMWASITRARALREVELAAGMNAEARDKWLAPKLTALYKAARHRMIAAEKCSDAEISAALVDDAEFAAAKWSFYGPGA